MSASNEGYKLVTGGGSERKDSCITQEGKVYFQQ